MTVTGVPAVGLVGQYLHRLFFIHRELEAGGAGGAGVDPGALLHGAVGFGGVVNGDIFDFRRGLVLLVVVLGVVDDRLTDRQAGRSQYIFDFHGAFSLVFGRSRGGVVGGIGGRLLHFSGTA
ncbi:hypothetical protein SDC9_149456 [bioreactor metagenome]|uniref:Uncharacterized protein n=1 Tax=bioreactor metagenome TaxID=1076179 RepID=A0A645ELT1_9ZZZZ